MKQLFLYTVSLAALFALYRLTHSLVYELCRTPELKGILDFACLLHLFLLYFRSLSWICTLFFSEL